MNGGKKMADISNEVLAILVIAAMAISLAGTMSTLSYLGAESPITGFYSGITNVTVTRLAAIDILVALVDFGNMAQSATDSTEDYVPHPFVINNNGTVFVNISMWSELLWPSAMAYNNTFYVFNASVNSTDNSLSTVQSGWLQDTFANVSDADQGVDNVGTCINSSKDADAINVHINVTVPLGADAGSHTVTVTFTGTDSGIGTCGAGT